MQSIEYSSECFSGPVNQDIHVRVWSKKYKSLVETLGQLGTMVKTKRTLEHDKDVAPYRFVRSAIHEFIFPPQVGGQVTGNSHVIDDTPGYQLFGEDIEVVFDPTLVKAHLRVTYDDADSRIDFEVTDLLGDSEITAQVQSAINSSEIANPNLA